MSKPIRVLVFGTTGTGKTSLCNALTGKDRPVSNSAKGVTFVSHTYDQVGIDVGKSLIITDTAGLNEAESGTVNPQNAIDELIKLLRNSSEGYNLLIHVFRIPRITKSEETNYKFFVKLIADSKIPTILVATGCENNDPMSKWKKDNAHIFSEMGLHYKDIICTCFASGGRMASIFDELREESSQAVVQAINTYATSEPVKIYSPGEGVFVVFKKAWNWLVDWFGAEKLRFNINEKLIELIMYTGCSREEAKTIARRHGFSI
jgi:predicted GTPase